ncbi:type II secretion system secretin GspD [Kordiimonas pumila]|uniref:Type II secretion system secretin GspD n=1 Tax=Kordiimonas pumila TaxID=2161677 RepID=A0ABV7D6I6_9PROT|nr:type II secretion system secretin GspD [Kordiimonas pumila]
MIKSMKYALLSCLLMSSFQTGAVQAASEGQVLNYNDADIRVFIDDIAALTGRTFIIDPRVKGKVNVVSSEQVSAEGVFQTFLSALRVNGFTVVPTASGAFKIVPDDVAGQDSTLVGASGRGDQLVTRVFTLKFADPLAVQAAAKPFIDKNGRTFARKGMQLVIMTDYAENLRRIADLIASMDTDPSVIRTLTLENTSATEMAEIALSLSTQPGFEDSARLTLTALPLESSNTLILKGSRDVIDSFLPVLKELDKSNASRGDLRVIYLKHASAEKLLPMLETITKSLSRKDATGKELPGNSDVTISSYAGANALVINASSEMQQKVAGVIHMLDLPRAQVLVEAIVVEVSEGAAKNLGVQYILAGGDRSNIPFTVANYSNTAPNILAVTGALALDGDSSSSDGDSDSTSTSDLLKATAVDSLLGLNGFALGIGGQSDNGTIFGAVLTALKQDTGSNILSTPSIVTMDNEPARFLSGQEIPVTTGEALGSSNTNPFRTIERKDVGVQLEVTPQVNEGDEIRLAIRQEISSIAGSVGTDSSQLITNKREIQTTVRVKDGEIVVLGGLIEQTESTRTDKIPLLGDIPILGHAFRSDSKSSAKTNLMIFLRPTILRSSDDLKAATGHKYGYMRAKQAGIKSQIPLDVLVQEVMGGTAPDMQGNN